MTPEAQRTAIAETCPNIQQFGDYDLHGWFVCINNDPLSDLNAMHEAEKVLTDNQYLKFLDVLCLVTTGVEVGPFRGQAYWYNKRSDLAVKMFKATAAQLAEAFCRVKYPERWK